MLLFWSSIHQVRLLLIVLPECSLQLKHHATQKQCWHLGMPEVLDRSLSASDTAEYQDRFSQVQGFCASFDYNCQYKGASTALQAILFASWLFWIILWIYYIFTALRDLHLRPWHK